MPRITATPVAVSVETPATPAIAATTTAAPGVAHHTHAHVLPQGTVALESSEEFLIGCLSGIAGAILSFLELPTLYWLLCIFLIPPFLLEVWESWALFVVATRNNGVTPPMHLLQTAARKRLARQLFGQGVIMGQAGVDLQDPSSLFFDNDSEYAVLSTVTFYACLWLLWILSCHVLNEIPPEDKVAAQMEKRKAARRSHSMTLKCMRRSNSSVPMGGSIAPLSHVPQGAGAGSSSSSTMSSGGSVTSQSSVSSAGSRRSKSRRIRRPRRHNSSHSLHHHMEMP